MNSDHQPDAEVKPDVAIKPVIPPPDLVRRPTPPPSPRDPYEKSPTPPAREAGNPAARVNLRPLRDAAEFGYDDSAAAGIASFNSRVVAVVIDLLVAFGVPLGLGWLLPDFAGRLAQLAGTAYFITRDSLPFFAGQSVGKKAMKLKVTTCDGDPLVNHWSAALIRNGVLLIPFFVFVEIFILLTRDGGVDRGRRLGDKWAKTQVIVEKPAAAEHDDDIQTP